MLRLWPTARAEVDIPYTAFLAQVRADNIASIHIAGDQITGTFVKPLLWPPSIPTAASSTSPHPPDSLALFSLQPLAPHSAHYGAFHTAFPQSIGDPALMPLLESHKVVIDVSPPPSHWSILLLTEGLPLVFLVAFFVLARRQATQGRGGLFGFGRSNARRYTSDHPEVTLADVAGADEAKAELEEEVDFLRQPRVRPLHPGQNRGASHCLHRRIGCRGAPARRWVGRGQR
jgi:cell division protease FtsH